MMDLMSTEPSVDVSTLSVVACCLMTEYIVRNVSLGDSVVRTSVCSHGLRWRSLLLTQALGHLCHIYAWSLTKTLCGM